MRIELDVGRCQGHLRCMDLAPELFDCNELGYGQLRSDEPIPEELEQVARRSAANCPEHAINLSSADVR